MMLNVKHTENVLISRKINKIKRPQKIAILFHILRPSLVTVVLLANAFMIQSIHLYSIENNRNFLFVLNYSTA